MRKKKAEVNKKKEQDENIKTEIKQSNKKRKQKVKDVKNPFLILKSFGFLFTNLTS